MYSSEQKFEINGCTDEELGIILNCAICLYDMKGLPSYYALRENRLYLGYFKEKGFKPIMPEFAINEEVLIAFVKSFLAIPHLYDNVSAHYANMLNSFDGSVNNGFRAFVPTLNSSSKDYFAGADSTILGFEPDLIFYSK